MKNTIQKHKLLFQHIIGVFTILMYLFLSHRFVGYEKGFNFLETISATILLWTGFSIIHFHLQKHLSWSKGITKRLIIEIIIVILYSTLIVLLFYSINIYIRGIKFDPLVLRESIVGTSLISTGVIAVIEAIELFSNWKESIITSNKLEKENIEAQFLTLKNQINPHFLFNSLNTLANYVQDNPKANKYIENLSEYLRNSLMLKESDVISIKEELNMVNSYFFLQKARFMENIELDISIPENIKNESYVPPFSLQMLVENAIKHNIISKQKPLKIVIYTDDNYLTVKNNLQIKETQISTKIGLKNIKDRYKLLTEHETIINQTDTEFIVSVPLLKHLNK